MPTERTLKTHPRLLTMSSVDSKWTNFEIFTHYPNSDSHITAPFTVSQICCTNLCSNTHTRLTALCPGLPGWASTRKVKPIWILLEQETVSGSGTSWAICKSAPRCRQITMPAPHCSVFLQAGCPSCHPNQQCQSTEGTCAPIRLTK